MIPAGIVTALPAEARTLLGGLPTGRIPLDTVIPFAGHFLIVSGMGPACAAAAARRLVDDGARALLSWGCAGALAAHLQPGVLLLPQAVRGRDAHTYTADRSWHDRLHERLRAHLPVDTNLLVTSDSVMVSSTAKAELHVRTGGVAVDMESAALAMTAQELQVPFAVLRAVADACSLSIPAYIPEVTDAYGRARPLPLAAAMMRQPSSVLALLALRSAWSRALQTLRAAARLLGGELATRP